MKLAIVLASACAALVAMAGCDDHDATSPTGTTQAGTTTGSGGHGGHHDVDELACEHLQDGPFVDVTATVDTTDAPDVSAEHTAFHVTLADAGAGGSGGGGGSTATRGGYLSFAPDAEAHYVFFLGADVPFAVEDSSGGSVAIHESCDPAACSDACADIRGRHVVELSVGTYYLSFGPTSETEVALVREEEGHAH